MTSTTQPKVLLVEDDERLASLVRDYLAARGFSVAIEVRGDRALARVAKEEPDIVILDIGLPGLDGLSVCRELRRSYEGTIVMLTARGEDPDEIVGLECGADDYLRKPVSPGLLAARLSAHLRRMKSHGVRDLIQVGSLQVSRRAREVRVDERVVHLTSAEFDLLWVLAEGAGEVQSRDDLYLRLCGSEFDGLDRSIDLRVSRLRKKLGDNARRPFLIKSVRHIGYLLVTR
jgi:two-component system response regulator RstA